MMKKSKLATKIIASALAGSLALGIVGGGLFLGTSFDSGLVAHAKEAIGITVAGIQVTKDNAGDVLGDGGKVSYDPETNTLTLNNATICTSKDEGDKSITGIEVSDDIDIVLIGNNVIGNADDWDQENPKYDDYAVSIGIEVTGNVSFSGSGTLTIYDYEAGIEAKNVSFGSPDKAFTGKVNIYDFGGENDECAIKAKSEYDSKTYERVGGNVTIYGGTFDLNSKNSNGIEADGNVTINNASVTVNAGNETTDNITLGFKVDGDLEITDSKVSAKAISGKKTAIGISASTIEISGNKSDVTAIGNSEYESAGIQAIGKFTIVDGMVKAKGSALAIMATSKEEENLFIGSESKPMPIKNATKWKDAKGSASEDITEGKGLIEYGWKDGDYYYTVLASADAKAEDGFVVIGAKSSNDAPQPQQGAGASVINTADLAGDINKINNKFVAGVKFEGKIFLSASDFNIGKVNTTVNALVENEQKINEANDFNTFYSKMFNEQYDITKEMGFLKKLITVMFLGKF